MKILSVLIFAIALLSAFLGGYFFPKNFAPHTIINPSYSPDSKQFQANSELPDFASYKDVTLKKTDFFSYMLPRVKKANQAIIQERKWVESLLSQQGELEPSQMGQLLALSEKYKVKVLNPNGIISELLIRIDTIPASLVLAQAANESAWGTSRFAKQGNNLFGQWCYVKGCGIIPSRRTENQNHEVASFNSIQHSISSYMRNLNTQAAYEKLRKLRKNLRENKQIISGLELAHGLLKYSTRREAYVEEIQLMIKQNKLSQHD